MYALCEFVNRMAKICLKKIDFNFTIKLAGDGTEHVSSEVVVADVPWKIEIRERKDGNEMVIEATLICSSPKELKADQQWTCQAMAKVSVGSFGARQQFNEKIIRRSAANVYPANQSTSSQPPICRTTQRMVASRLMSNCS